ncbi:MAG: carbohydrate ABC transporter permease [Anaerolineae bacterium]|nr:carbohydrate ABC transporter permease [Anaerolineae bacterium]MCA9891780.1 carbohydrate ABC transporter permease [Anaerolineae bacterium]
MTGTQQIWLARLSSWAVVLLWAAFVIIPLAIMVSVAVKSPAEFATNPFGLPQEFAWDNFTKAWNDADLGRGIVNSLILTVTSLFIIVIFSASAAYPIARRTHWSPLFYFFLSGIMIPFQLTMLPLYRLMKSLELINTYQGVILIYTAVSLPMAIFLYAGFIKGINRELEDAALVDGAGRFRMFWMVVFPLLKPVTATTIIMNIISLWNDFFIVLLYLPKREMRTLQLSIFTFVGQYNSDLNYVMAAVILSIAPMIIVFLLLQKQFVQGIAGGAVKG